MISKQTGRANLGWHAVVKSFDKEEKGNVATLALLPDEGTANGGRP